MQNCVLLMENISAYTAHIYPLHTKHIKIIKKRMYCQKKITIKKNTGKWIYDSKMIVSCHKCNKVFKCESHLQADIEISAGNGQYKHKFYNQILVSYNT